MKRVKLTQGKFALVDDEDFEAIKNKELAIKARKMAEIKYFGEFSPTRRGVSSY